MNKLTTFKFLILSVLCSGFFAENIFAQNQAKVNGNTNSIGTAAWDKAKEAGEYIKEGSKEALEKTGEVAESAWDKTKEAGEYIKEGSKDALEKTGEVAESAWDKTKNMAYSGWEKVKNFFTSMFKKDPTPNVSAQDAATNAADK